MKKICRRVVSALLAVAILFSQNPEVSYAYDKKTAKPSSDEYASTEEEEDYQESAAVAEPEKDTGEVISSADSEPATVVSEIIDARDEFSKQYLLSDNSKSLVLYSEPVHYLSEDGTYVEIDNSVKKTEEGYENVDNTYSVVFTDNEESKGEVRFEEDEYQVKWEYVDSSESVSESENTSEPDNDSEIEIIPENSQEYEIIADSDQSPEMESIPSDEVSIEDDADNEYRNADDTEDKITDEDTDEDTDNYQESNQDEITEETNSELDVSVEEAGADYGEEESIGHVVNSSTVTYDGYSDGVKLEYSPTGLGVKENIILPGRESGNVFSFKIQLSGLEARVTSANEVELYDENSGEVKYYFPAPFMTDSDDNESYEIWYSLSNNLPQEEYIDILDNEDTEDLKDELSAVEELATSEDGYIYLTLTADEKWLDNAKYPVTIDPVIKKVRNDLLLDSFCINDHNAVNEDSLYVGSEKIKNPDGKKEPVIFRSYIKFELPNIEKGSVVTDAQLYLSGSESSINKNYVVIRKADSKWSYRKVDNETRIKDWKDRPSTDSRILDYAKNGGYFNITKAVRDWYADPSENNGLEFSAYDETITSKDSIRLSQSSSRPYLKVTFKNFTGLENYFSSHSASAGTAGVGYINDYTGALTVVNTDVSTNGLRMPFNIQHVYNSNTEEGWKISYDQRIVIPANELDIGTYPYVYYDGDGTKHYFKAKEVTYLENGEKKTAKKNPSEKVGYPAAEDEDGLKLCIVPVTDKDLKDTYPLKMLDKSGSLV